MSTLTPETKKLLLHAIDNSIGDDLQRAKAAFRHCTPEQMQQEYGQSGKTRQQILDEYEADNAKWERARAEVKAS